MNAVAKVLATHAGITGSNAHEGLEQFLNTDSVLLSLNATSKPQALKALASFAAGKLGLSESMIADALMAREQQGCTGFGGGICLPHARLEVLDTAHAFFARLETPIVFGAADNQPVDLIFLLLSPLLHDAAHLKALALATRALRNEERASAIRGARSVEEMFALLIEPSSTEFSVLHAV